MTTLDRIHAAAKAGHLLASTAENLAAFLGANLPAWAWQSIDELVGQGAWGELNDRFYRCAGKQVPGLRGGVNAVKGGHGWSG